MWEHGLYIPITSKEALPFGELMERGFLAVVVGTAADLYSTAHFSWKEVNTAMGLGSRGLSRWG